MALAHPSRGATRQTSPQSAGSSAAAAAGSGAVEVVAVDAVDCSSSSLLSVAGCNATWWECHLCRVAGNTVWSHVACEFPERCGNLANCYTLVTYLITYRVGADRMADGTQELETIVDTGVEPRQTLPWCAATRWQCSTCASAGGCSTRCGCVRRHASGRQWRLADATKTKIDYKRYAQLGEIHSVIVHLPRFPPSFSTPAKSTHAISSVIVHSRIVHSCNFSAPGSPR